MFIDFDSLYEFSLMSVHDLILSLFVDLIFSILSSLYSVF